MLYQLSYTPIEPPPGKGSLQTMNSAPEWLPARAHR